MRTFRNIFYLMLVVSLCAGAGTAQAESQMPKSGSSANSSKFYNPNGTKFYNPSPLPKVKFDWPEFKFPEFKFPEFQFPKFFEETAQPEGESAEGRVGGAGADAEAAPAQVGDELFHPELLKMVDKIKGILKSQEFLQVGETGDVTQKKPAASALSQTKAPSKEADLMTVLNDLVSSQKTAQVDPAKALDMAYAVQAKAEQRQREIEEEVRRMEEGY